MKRSEMLVVSLRCIKQGSGLTQNVHQRIFYFYDALEEIVIKNVLNYDPYFGWISAGLSNPDF